MAPASLHSSIQHAILAAADRVNLKWPGLPPETWAMLQNDPAEADRIEFLGDAVVRLVLSHEVYKRYPREGPGLYTKVVQALYSNLTFYSLFQKPEADGTRLRLSRRGQGEELVPKFTRIERSVFKPVGDKFESVVGAFYLEYGLAELETWLIKLFDPLIVAAYLEFKRCEQLGLYGLVRSEGSAKRPSDADLPPTPSSTYKRARHSEDRRPYTARHTQPRKDVSWWQKLATAAGQKLGGGAFQNYEFTFQTPINSSSSNTTTTSSTPNKESNPSTSSLTITNHLLGYPDDSPALNSSSQPSYATVVGRPPMRTVAPLPRRMTGYITTNSHIMVPKSSVPIVIDLTLDDDDVPLSAEAQRVTRRPAVPSASSGSSLDTQLPSKALLKDTAENTAFCRISNTSGVQATQNTNEFIDILNDNQAENVSFATRTTSSPPCMDFSAMDITFGINNDYIPLPEDSDSDNERATPAAIHPLESATNMGSSFATEDEDEQEMTEVEKLLDWIENLGPTVDRVNLNQSPIKPATLAASVRSDVASSRDRLPKACVPSGASLESNPRPAIFGSHSYMPTFTLQKSTSASARSEPAFSLQDVPSNSISFPQLQRGAKNNTEHQLSVLKENNPSRTATSLSKTKRATKATSVKPPKSIRGTSVWTLPHGDELTPNVPSNEASATAAPFHNASASTKPSSSKQSYAQALRFNPMRRR